MRIARRLATIVGFIGWVAAAAGQTRVYPPSDPAADIAAAIAAAGKDGRYVLIDFGADWCPDCRVLGALLDSPTVAPFVDANFHVVHVDVGRRDKNADIVAKYHATSDAWIPAVVVLDATGTTVAVTDDNLRLTRRDTPDQLLAVLRQWAPKKKWADLSAFTEDGVRVDLSLEQDTSGRVWLAGRFSPVQAGVHLYSKDLPAAGLDGIGRPTRLAVAAPRGLRILGDVSADRPVEADRIDVLNQAWPVYPAGPVTLRVPVAFDPSVQETPADVSVSYMACGPSGCLRPVLDRHVVVTVPAPRLPSLRWPQ